MHLPVSADILRKYDVALPRYTSYPTVPFWDFSGFSVASWKEELKKRFKVEQGEISIYIHLPFCEELCTYCACNKRITKNHSVEIPYLKAVLHEWKLYKSLFPSRPVIREIHLGGGTPTFFSPAHLEELISGIVEDCDLSREHSFSVELHPNYTSDEHLRVLRSCGFNRISVGVQDFDPAVQFIINRIQSFEQTRHVIDKARELGFESVNIDLVYGLPKQNVNCVSNTIFKIGELKPDRIAFYSYAHVPWKSKGQRRYDDDDVPGAEDKRAMYMKGKEMLEMIGYESIGMDHFALPGDALHTAYDRGDLHRNFMGYTSHKSKLLIGLGASSISDSWTAFAQNEKTVEDYQDKILSGELPLVNGHLLNEKDQLTRQYILDLMCRGKLELDAEQKEKAQEALIEFEKDGILKLSGNTLQVTPLGRAFVRNISAVFDEYLKENRSKLPLFSKAV